MLSNQSIESASFYWELPSSLNVQLGLTDEQKGKILIKDLLLENKQILKIHNRNVFIRCLLLKDGF